MTTPSEERLVHDWALMGSEEAQAPPLAMLDDETLRDGLQSPSVLDPPIEEKIKILHFMNDMGIETANVGLPGSGPRQRESAKLLCQEISDSGLKIKANCAARTLEADIAPIAEVVQETGVPIEACVFIGSSPIRQYAEEWDISHVIRRPGRGAGGPAPHRGHPDGHTRATPAALPGSRGCRGQTPLPL